MNSLALRFGDPSLSSESLSTKSEKVSHDKNEHLRKRLKMMFRLASEVTEEEENGEGGKDGKKKAILSENMEEHIWKKKEMKWLYLTVPKKSGYGYRLNYNPGGEKTSKLVIEGPKKPDKTSYEYILKKLLVAEGLAPPESPKTPWPGPDDLSPWPGKASNQFWNNKFFNHQKQAQVLAKYLQVEGIEQYAVFKPKPKEEIEEDDEEEYEEEDYDNDEERNDLESDIDSEEEPQEGKPTSPSKKKRKKENIKTWFVYLQNGCGENYEPDSMPNWFKPEVDKASLWRFDGVTLQNSHCVSPKKEWKPSKTAKLDKSRI